MLKSIFLLFELNFCIRPTGWTIFCRLCSHVPSLYICLLFLSKTRKIIFLIPILIFAFWVIYFECVFSTQKFVVRFQSWLQLFTIVCWINILGSLGCYFNKPTRLCKAFLQCGSSQSQNILGIFATNIRSNKTV